MARPQNALIVDDEAHARTYVRLLLRDVGIETCWEAGDRTEALAQLRAHAPELVLLDVNLRMTSGLRLLEEIKAERPDVPVVMLSSENASKTVGEAVRLGAHAYILKHSPREMALQALCEVLEDAEDDAPAGS